MKPMTSALLALLARPVRAQARRRRRRRSSGGLSGGVASCNHCHTPLKMGPKGPEPDMSRMLTDTRPN